MSSLFESAQLKIERAIEHINNLQTLFEDFIASNPKRIVTQTDPQTQNLILKVRFDAPIPKQFGLIIGDAIHNLKSSLDHLVWELIEIDGGAQDNNLVFPVSKGSRNDYEARCNRIDTPRPDTKQFLCGFEIYPGGNGDRLYQLHSLDIIDKHRMITPTIAATSLRNIHITDGSSNIKVGFIQATVGKDGYSNFASVGKGFSIEFDADSATVDIFFKNIQGFEDVPINRALMEFVNNVRDVRERVCRFVADRS